MKGVAATMKGDRGATLVFLMVVLLALISMAALAIDVGQMYIAKQKCQNACDAAALAGVRYLTRGGAEAVANDCAVANNEGSAWTVCAKGSVTASSPKGTPGVTVTFPAEKQITAEGEVPVTFAFAGVFGSGSANIGASATAALVEAEGLKSSIILPLAISSDTLIGPTPAQLGSSVTLKVGDWRDGFIGAGNFGIVTLPGDGNGGGVAKERVAGPTGDKNYDLPPVSVPTLPATISTQPGNMASIVDALSDRIGSDTYTFGTWVQGYNPVSGQYPATSRIVVVPVITVAPGSNGNSDVLLVGFAGVFIDYYDKQTKTITARFIQGIIGGDGSFTWLPGTSGSAGSDNLILRYALIK